MVVTSFRADGYRMVKYGSDCLASVDAELSNDDAPGGSRAEHLIDHQQGGVLCDLHTKPAPFERDEPGRLHIANVAHGTEVAMDNLSCTLYPGHDARRQLAMFVRTFHDLRRFALAHPA
jgi:hypothetical protein